MTAGTDVALVDHGAVQRAGVAADVAAFTSGGALDGQVAPAQGRSIEQFEQAYLEPAADSLTTDGLSSDQSLSLALNGLMQARGYTIDELPSTAEMARIDPAHFALLSSHWGTELPHKVRLAQAAMLRLGDGVVNAAYRAGLHMKIEYLDMLVEQESRRHRSGRSTGRTGTMATTKPNPGANASLKNQHATAVKAKIAALANGDHAGAQRWDKVSMALAQRMAPPAE